MLVQSALLGCAVLLVLGFSGMLQGFGAIEVDLCVDSGALFGDSLLEGFGNGFGFGWREGKSRVSCE